MKNSPNPPKGPKHRFIVRHDGNTCFVYDRLTRCEVYRCPMHNADCVFLERRRLADTLGLMPPMPE